MSVYKKINKETGKEAYVYRIHKEEHVYRIYKRKAISIRPIDVEDSLDFESEYTIKELKKRFPPSKYDTVEVKNE